MNILGYNIVTETEWNNINIKNRKLAQGVTAWKDEYTRLNQGLEKAQAELIQLRPKCLHVQELEKENAKMVITISTMQGQITALETAIQEHQDQQKETGAIIEKQDALIAEYEPLIKTLTKPESWVFVGENNDEVGYGATNKAGIRLSLLKVKKQHLTELPCKTETGMDIYKDGSSYPCSLMDYIRASKPESLKIVAEVRPTYPITQNEPNEPIGDNRDERTEPAVNESNEPDNEDNESSFLPPNQTKVINELIVNPGSVHKDLAETLNMDKSNLSKVLSSLVQKALIYMDSEGHYFVVGS